MGANTTQPGRRAAAGPARQTSGNGNQTPQQGRDRGPNPKNIRKTAAPYFLLAGIALSAEIAHAATTMTGDAAIVAAVMAAIVSGLVLLIWIAGRAKHRLRRLHAFGSVAAAGILTAIYTTSGWHMSSLAAGFLATTVAGVSYWRTLRLPDPADPNRRPPAPKTPKFVRRWADHVGCVNGPVEGTALELARTEGDAQVYRLELRPGKQSLKSVRDSLPLIASGLRISPYALSVDGGDPDDSTIVEVTISTISATDREKVTAWNPPPFDKLGRVRFGHWMDTGDTVYWKLYGVDADEDAGSYTITGMRSGAMIGFSGSGKTASMRGLALGVAARGDTTVFYIDGQAFADPDDRSDPRLARWAYRYATSVPEAMSLLEEAERIATLHAKQRLDAFANGWSPELGGRGVLILIDECHFVLQDLRIQAKVAGMIRKFRKNGIGFVLSSQMPHLETFGPARGDSDSARESGGAPQAVIRDQARGGNMVGLRMPRGTSAGLLSDLPIKANELPEIPGVFSIRSEAGTRAAVGRTEYLSDAAFEKWAELIPCPEPTEEEKRFAASRPSGRDGQSDGGRPTTSSGSRVGQSDHGSGGRSGQSDPQSARGSGWPSVRLSRYDEFVESWEETDEEPCHDDGGEDDLELSDAERQVLTAVRVGVGSAAGIVNLTGVPQSTVYRLLGRLREAGLLVQVNNTWQVA